MEFWLDFAEGTRYLKLEFTKFLLDALEFVILRFLRLVRLLGPMLSV